MIKEEDKHLFKIKYRLGIHKMLPGYPTAEDIAFVAYDFLEKRKLLENGFDIKFIKRISGIDISDERAQNIIKELHEKGIIDIIKEDKKVPERTRYRILKNIV